MSHLKSNGNGVPTVITWVQWTGDNTVCFTVMQGSEILTITKCLCNLRVNAPSRRVETLLETFIYEMCRVNRLKEYDPRQLSQVISMGRSRVNQRFNRINCVDLC